MARYERGRPLGTTKNRGRHDRSKLRSRSDRADAERALVAPLILPGLALLQHARTPLDALEIEQFQEPGLELVATYERTSASNCLWIASLPAQTEPLPIMSSPPSASVTKPPASRTITMPAAMSQDFRPRSQNPS